MLAEVLLNGRIRQAQSGPNASITIQLIAPKAQRYFIAGLEAHYDGPVAAVRRIDVNGLDQTAFGSGLKIYRWDFTKGAFVHNFPLIVHGDYNAQTDITLEASGVGGVSGFISAWVALV